MIQKELTDGEKAVYECIVEYITKNGFAPTVREICGLKGYASTASVHYIIQGLIAKKMIKHQNKPRTITVIGYKWVKDDSE